MFTPHLKEDKNMLDPDKCARITVTLPISNERFRILLDTDTIFGFPLLSRVDPSSHLQTYIPMSMQGNCWIAAINTKKNILHWQAMTMPGTEWSSQQPNNFHRKIKPVTLEYQILGAMWDQMDIDTLIVRHIIAMPDQPAALCSIHLCLKNNICKYWNAGLWNKYNTNANMLSLSEPVAKEPLPEDTAVHRSIVAVRTK